MDTSDLMDCNGETFMELARIQKEQLLKLATISENQLELDTDLGDEQKGLLRSAAGKARLLVTKRIEQFEGLCESSMNPKEGELSVGSTDLAGFWDMVMIEVKSLHATFRGLALPESAIPNLEETFDIDKLSLAENEPEEEQSNQLKRTCSNAELILSLPGSEDKQGEGDKSSRQVTGSDEILGEDIPQEEEAYGLGKEALPKKENDEEKVTVLHVCHVPSSN